MIVAVEVVVDDKGRDWRREGGFEPVLSGG